VVKLISRVKKMLRFSESEIDYLKAGVRKWIGNKQYKHIAEKMIRLLQQDEEEKTQLFLKAYSGLLREQQN
jgi:hypothetical protein